MEAEMTDDVPQISAGRSLNYTNC